MSKHLTHKPGGPFHWDGQEPVAKPEPRPCQVCVALVDEIKRLRAVIAVLQPTNLEPSDYDVEGLTP